MVKSLDQSQVGKFSSDLFPQHAIIYFPRKQLPENFIVFSLRAIKGMDGKMFIDRDMNL